MARRNLALLDPGGLDARAAELAALAVRHDKPGYDDAAAAARRLVTSAVPHEVAVADATDLVAIGSVVERHRPLVVIADLPHGRQTDWTGGADPGVEPVAALASVLPPDAVLAVVGHGRRLGLQSGTRALERLRVGHRAAALVRAGDVPAVG